MVADWNSASEINGRELSKRASAEMVAVKIGFVARTSEMKTPIRGYIAFENGPPLAGGPDKSQDNRKQDASTGGNSLRR